MADEKNTAPLAAAANPPPPSSPAVRLPLPGLRAPANTPTGSGGSTPALPEKALTPTQNQNKRALSGKSEDDDNVVEAVQAKLGELAMQQTTDTDGDEGNQIHSEDEEEDAIPPEVYVRVTLLKDIHEKYTEEQKEYFKERKLLERKYLLKYQAFFDQRRGIVSGDTAVEVDPEATAAAEAAGMATYTGLPNFWLEAMTNNEYLQEAITERDCTALAYLYDIKLLDVPEDDKYGYRLEFYFKENPYFTESVLSKTYYIPNFYDSSDPILESAMGCEISWKTKKANLTVEMREKKQRNRRAGGKQANKSQKLVMEPVDSFFRWFSTPWMAKEDETSGDEEERFNQAEYDFHIAEQIRQKLVPQAVLWYTGEAAEGDDEEDEEDESEEDEDGDAPALATVNEGEGTLAEGQENPAECKQQ